MGFQIREAHNHKVLNFESPQGVGWGRSDILTCHHGKPTPGTGMTRNRHWDRTAPCQSCLVWMLGECIPRPASPSVFACSRSPASPRLPVPVPVQRARSVRPSRRTTAPAPPAPVAPPAPPAREGRRRKGGLPRPAAGSGRGGPRRGCLVALGSDLTSRIRSHHAGVSLTSSCNSSLYLAVFNIATSGSPFGSNGTLMWWLVILVGVTFGQLLDVDRRWWVTCLVGLISR